VAHKVNKVNDAITINNACFSLFSYFSSSCPASTTSIDLKTHLM